MPANSKTRRSTGSGRKKLSAYARRVIRESQETFPETRKKQEEVLAEIAKLPLIELDPPPAEMIRRLRDAQEQCIEPVHPLDRRAGKRHKSGQGGAMPANSKTRRNTGSGRKKLSAYARRVIRESEEMLPETSKRKAEVLARLAKLPLIELDPPPAEIIRRLRDAQERS